MKVVKRRVMMMTMMNRSQKQLHFKLILTVYVHFQVIQNWNTLLAN
jgi:hypothetical protein